VAAPTLHAVGDLFAAATGFSITPVIPAGQLNNDVAVMACMCNASSTFTTPTNWTILGTTVSSTNQSTAWFWKRLTGSDGNPTSNTGAGGSSTVGLYGRIYVWRGCVTTGDPFEAAANAGTPTSSTTPQTSEVITTGADRLACSLLLVDDDNVWNSGMPPAGWANMGGRLVSTLGGDCMSDAISRTVPTATTITAATFGTMSASDYWRSLSFALIPETAAPVFGTATGNYIYIGAATGTIGAGVVAQGRAPIPAVLMVATPSAWNTHPYYKTPVTISNWGNATDMAAIDSALAAYPARTRVTLIAEDSDTSLGNAAAAMNWAFRHYEQVHAIALRTPIIDLEERHDRVAGDATSIETAYGGSGTYLNVTGAQGGGSTTPDAAALDITGDIDIRFELRPAIWSDPNVFWRIIGGKWVETGSQRSWRLLIRGIADDSGALIGRLQFNWSSTGANSLSAISTAGPGSVLGTDIGAIRVTLDVVNGTDKTVTFYTSPTIGGTWTQLGSAVTTTGNTSVFSSTAPVEIGTINNRTETTFFDPFAGIVRKFELRNGIGGTAVANPDFTARTVGATSFADATGKTWTVHSPASIEAGFLDAMPLWNPGAPHRQDIAAHLLGDRLHIWRDPSDTVTPIAVTDAIATRARATLHTSLGTTDDVVPDGQDWINQPGWVEQRKLHDYARANASTAGTWKSADGGNTVILPDGRWFSYFSDTSVDLLDPDDTFQTYGNIVRNSAIVHNSSGTITGQHYSAGIGTVAFQPDQTDFPGTFYWPVGGCIDNGNLQIVCDHREGAGFGTDYDYVVLTLDPDDFSFIARTSLGVPAFLLQNLIPDPATGFIYATIANPSRIARVPIGQLTNIAIWEYWDGNTWQGDRLAGTQVSELVDGQTRPLRINAINDGWDIRRYGNGWLAVVRGWWEPYIGIYYSTVPQGPWTRYRYLPTPETGGLRYSNTIYAYTPFWHLERDPAPDRLMISYNGITLSSDVPGVDMDFLYTDTHFVVCPIYRGLFP
jgi:hypothetical protein